MKYFQTLLSILVLLLGGYSPEAFAATPLRMEGVDFYYKGDSEARYIGLRETWASQNKGGIALPDAERLALQAEEAASLEKPLTSWIRQGGPHPYVFQAKVHLQNPTKLAILNQKLQITVRAKTGDLRVNPQLLMTDYQYLSQTAQWETLLQYTTTVPVIAPGEEMLVPVLQFQLIRFLRLHPNQWPEFLQVEATLQGGKPKTGTLRLLPDHFVVPNEV